MPPSSAPSDLWHVRDGSMLKEIDEERLLTWLRQRHLSGLEAARRKGSKRLRPLYTFDVFQPFWVAGRDAYRSAVHREWLRVRFAVFLFVGLAVGYALYFILLGLPKILAIIVGAILLFGFPLMAQSSIVNLWRHHKMGDIEAMKNTFD